MSTTRESTTEDAPTDEKKTQTTDGVTVSKTSPALDDPREYAAFLPDNVARDLESKHASEFVLEAARRQNNVEGFNVDVTDTLRVDLTLAAEYDVVAVGEELLDLAAEYALRVAAICERNDGTVGVSFVEVER
jgi:hypothetical protein